MNPVLERRLRQLRSRVLVRSWHYRQRRHARGAWFRLRRVLAEAAEAYVVSPDAIRQLLAEGHPAESAGAELDPPKAIVFVTSERAAQIPDARPVSLRLAGDLLLAERLVLVRFTTPPSGTAPRPPDSV